MWYSFLIYFLLTLFVQKHHVFKILFIFYILSPGLCTSCTFCYLFTIIYSLIARFFKKFTFVKEMWGEEEGKTWIKANIFGATKISTLDSRKQKTLFATLPRGKKIFATQITSNPDLLLEFENDFYMTEQGARLEGGKVIGIPWKMQFFTERFLLM